MAPSLDELRGWLKAGAPDPAEQPKKSEYEPGTLMDVLLGGEAEERKLDPPPSLPPKHSNSRSVVIDDHVPGLPSRVELINVRGPRAVTGVEYNTRMLTLGDRLMGAECEVTRSGVLMFSDTIAHHPGDVVVIHKGIPDASERYMFDGVEGWVNTKANKFPAGSSSWEHKVFDKPTPTPPKTSEVDGFYTVALNEVLGKLNRMFPRLQSDDKVTTGPKYAMANHTIDLTKAMRTDISRKAALDAFKKDVLSQLISAIGTVFSEDTDAMRHWAVDWSQAGVGQELDPETKNRVLHVAITVPVRLVHDVIPF